MTKSIKIKKYKKWAFNGSTVEEFKKDSILVIPKDICEINAQKLVDYDYADYIKEVEEVEEKEEVEKDWFN